MDNFETLLKEKGLTKTALSERLGIKKQNLNALTRNPTLETQRRIASALGIEVWELFVGRKQLLASSDSIGVCPHCGEPIVFEIRKP